MQGTSKNIATLFNGYLNVPFALTATVGNSLVLGAIWRTPSLHCATNVLMFSLALSGLGVGLIGQPLAVLEQLGLLKESQIFQVIAGSFAAVSLVTVTFIGVDRLLAVKLHMRYNEIVTIKKSVFAVVVIWFGSICAMSAIFLSRFSGAFEIAVCLTTLPCLFINIFVCRRLYRVCRFRRAGIQDQMTLQRDSGLCRRAIGEARFGGSLKALYFVVLAFTLCCFPFICVNVAMVTNKFNCLLKTLFNFSFTLTFVNSSVNPALLIFQLAELRLAIGRILKQSCGRQQETGALQTEIT